MTLERKKVKTPDLGHTTAIRYLASIFKAKLDGFKTVEDALAYLEQAEHLHIPEGLDSACLFVSERINVRGEMWTLRPSSRLAVIAGEAGDQGYFLISDGNMSGADSLFIGTSVFCEFNDTMAGDFSLLAQSWLAGGTPKLMLGSCRFRNAGEDSIMGIALAQLKSLVHV